MPTEEKNNSVEILCYFSKAHKNYDQNYSQYFFDRKSKLKFVSVQQG